MAQIPLVPQWNLNNGCVCTPDGGFLYIGSKSINFIGSGDGGERHIKVFHTRQSILSLDIDPQWGEQELKGQIGDSEDNKPCASRRQFAVLSQDNSVQIWDFEKGCSLQGHQAHLACMKYMEGNGPSPQHTGTVFISYMINRNVLSVDSQDIVVYCVASNSFYRRPMFLSPRNHQFTAMKCSPFNENIFALGTSRGLILLCDLQQMATIYTLRGHDAVVTCFAWNIVTHENSSCTTNSQRDIIRKDPPSSKQQKFTRTDTTIVDADDIFDIYDYDYLDNEFGAAASDARNSSDSVSDFVGIEKPDESLAATHFDFVEACQSLKDEITALRDEQPELLPEHVVSLEDCKNVAIKDDTSSCGSDNDDDKRPSDRQSSDGSVVRLVCGTPSSEESVDADSLNRVVCQAEVHADAKASVLYNTTQKIAKAIEATHISIQEKESRPGAATESANNGDVLLASVSADGTFCIWNSATGATCDQQKLRSNQGGRNSKLCICWCGNNSVIVSNKSGDLQMWSIREPAVGKTSSKAHVTQYKFAEEKGKLQQRSVVSFSVSRKQQSLWSITSNREILMQQVGEKAIKLQYGCVSTNISALRECPENMNKIALALSDRRIGILDISKMTDSVIRIDNYGQRIESPVLSLAWSPDCKRLAFGTSEGRVGVINVEAPKREPPFVFNSSCGKKIYSISWLDNYVYVVCNERIAVYEDNLKSKDPYILPEINAVSAISVRENYLFVGTQNGRLRLYKRKAVDNALLNYELKVELELASRYITEISWSPIAVNKVAVASNSSTIHILTFKPDTGDLKQIHSMNIKSDKAANACVKWSNRNENLLLTCGFDGAVRVWILGQENEKFVKFYHCPMTCGLFLPTDEEVVLCAGKSTTLEFIDMRIEKSDENSNKSKRLNPRKLDNVQWATRTSSRVDEKHSNRKKQPISMQKSTLCKERQKTTSCEVNSQRNTTGEEVCTMFENLNIQKPENPLATSNSTKIPQTLFYLTTKELNKDALDVMYTFMTNQICGKSPSDTSLSAKLFGSRSEARRLLDEESKNHQNSETKGIASIFMRELNGSLKEEIQKCVQTKQLSEWHVSLAPSISYSFWQKCCQAYAEQMVDQGCELQGALYYLAIHMQREAIDVLVRRNYFKEALLIARIYLQKDDPLLESIADRWITQLYNNGNLTGAALLCVLNKQYDRAYDCLCKIRNTGPDIERVLRLLKDKFYTQN